MKKIMILVLSAIVFLFCACEKKKAPEMGTINNYSEEATPYTLTVGASIYDIGSGTIEEKGFCYRRGGGLAPTYSDCDSVVKVQGYSGINYFKTTIGGLHPNTDYIIVAYAFNDVDTSYTNAIYIKTLR
ncbi:hypothetical protein LJC30_04545 [Odoribacter sp. OttesenSCG-928-L07]|nr:hypothetical protein [Odoribacter sp. OttesenSCG-928-L07]